MTSRPNENPTDREDAGTKQPWEPIKLTYVGNVAGVVQQGGGKVSTTTGDPGEPRKVPATG
jgi:hypothetical protein